MSNKATRKFRQHLYSYDEIFSRVREVLVCCLAVDSEKVTLEARLVHDLNCESIDRLDITFQMEKAFDINLPKGEFMDIMDGRFAHPEMMANGKLTEKGVTLLRNTVPYMDISEFESNPVVNNFYDIITVKMVVEYIYWKQQQV